MDIKQFIGGFVKVLPNLGGVGQNHTKVDVVTEAKIAIEIADVASRNGFRRGDGTLYVFTGTKYERLEREDIDRLICGILEELKIGVVYQTKSIETIFKRIYRSIKIKKFEPSRSIISFNNQILNISTMTVHPHSENWMTRIHLNFDYDMKARCPRWEQFLVDVMGDDYEGRMILQEFLGLMFVNNDELSIEASLFVYGTGSNGKSVIHYMMKSILDDYCSSYELTQLCSAQSDAGYYLADANGKLLNYASDMGKKEFSGGRFKAISGREPIMVRPIGKEPFEARDMPLMISNINEIPDTSDSTEGYWRRFLIIHLSRMFTAEQQDKELKYKLRAEMSGVFNWILEGRKRILAQKGHFTESQKMKNLVNKIRIESNSVLSFMQENNYFADEPVGVQFTPMAMFSRELMEAYKAYCLEWGNKPKAKKAFKTDLERAGFEYRTSMRIGGAFSNGYVFYKVDNVYGEEVNIQPVEHIRIEDDGMPF